MDLYSTKFSNRIDPKEKCESVLSEHSQPFPHSLSIFGGFGSVLKLVSHFESMKFAVPNEEADVLQPYRLNDVIAESILLWKKLHEVIFVGVLPVIAP